MTEKTHCQEIIFEGASRFESGICIGVNRDAWEGNPEDVVHFCFLSPEADSEPTEDGKRIYASTEKMMMTPKETRMIAGYLLKAADRAEELME